jgi:HJR/Mrr/RecB family endonuclease
MDAKMSAMVKEILQSWIMLGCCKARVTTNESPFRNYNKPCSESH